MSLTSLYFFVFLILLFILYYCFQSFQQFILLVGSVVFYYAVSPNAYWKITAMLMYILIVTYIGGRTIDTQTGWKKKIVFALAVLLLGALLVVTKYLYNVFELMHHFLSFSADFSFLQFGSIVGISYFLLSAIGYLADVYMGICESEKNVVRMSLFIFYFPQVISGPITRFTDMRNQFVLQHKLNYDAVSYGIRRMIWGYLKKLVISERFAVIVNAVYQDYSSYSAIGIFGATLCYAIQIYTDFSGCMDIVLGASELFGIKLPENFRAPYMSQSYQEFYQRWHMTLGNWMRDYVMYPVQKSKFIQKIGDKSRKILGKKRGKMVSFYLSMFILWVFIGVWHGGTALYFMVSTLIPFVFLVISDFLQPQFKKLNMILKIDTNKQSFIWFRRVRTWIVLCAIFLFLSAGSVHGGIDVLQHMVSNPISFTTFEVAIANMGLNSKDVVIMILGLIILLLSDIVEDTGTSLQEIMNRQNTAIRMFLILVEIVCVLFYGKFGQSQFIYFQF